MKPPKVFASYSWDNEEHKQWVQELSVRLRIDGVEVLLDQWELAPGDQLTGFMERAVRESDSVLVVCTPAYKRKSDQRSGGVGYEGDIMTAEVANGAPRRKFIPILRGEEWPASAPSWLLGSYYLDFRGDSVPASSYSELLDNLHGRRRVAPPVGQPRGALPGFDDLDLQMSGRRWLELTPPDNPGWSMVWQTLMRSRPKDSDLREVGRRWLELTSPNNSGWSAVWLTLMRSRPEDSDLREAGRRWLELVSPEHPDWGHVWSTLMKMNG